MSVMSPLQTLQHFNVINTGPQHYNVTNTRLQDCFYYLNKFNIFNVRNVSPADIATL